MPFIPNWKRKNNHLKIECPHPSTGAGKIYLNGKELRDVIGLEIKIPRDGEDRSLIRVRLEFYSALYLDVRFDRERPTRPKRP